MSEVFFQIYISLPIPVTDEGDSRKRLWCIFRRWRPAEDVSVQSDLRFTYIYSCTQRM